MKFGPVSLHVENLWHKGRISIRWIGKALNRGFWEEPCAGSSGAGFRIVGLPMLASLLGAGIVCFRHLPQWQLVLSMDESDVYCFEEAGSKDLDMIGDSRWGFTG